jgi:hypothetical protein
MTAVVRAPVTTIAKMMPGCVINQATALSRSFLTSYWIGRLSPTLSGLDSKFAGQAANVLVSGGGWL